MTTIDIVREYYNLIMQPVKDENSKARIREIENISWDIKSIKSRGDKK